MEKYTEVEEDIVNYFEQRKENLNLPIDINFLLLANSKLNKLIKFKKISDDLAFKIKKNVMVEINQQYFDSFDDDIKEILFAQEFGRIEFNSEKGTIKVSKLNFSSDKGCVEKYTYDNVKRAIETEELYKQQLKDKAKADKDAKKDKSGKKKNWKK